MSASDYVAPLCLACAVPFSCEPGAFPHSLSCGHVVCADCAAVIVNLASPMCTLCHTSVDEVYLPDPALATFAQALQREQTGSDEPAVCPNSGSEPSSLPLPTFPPCGRHQHTEACSICCDDGELVCSVCETDAHAGHVVFALHAASSFLRGKLVEARAACESGAMSCVSSMNPLQSARSRMERDCLASLNSMDAAVAAVKAALDAHAAKVRGAIQRKLKARLKALDAQVDAVAVSATQLSCGVALADSLLANGAASSLELARCYDSLRRMIVLDVPYRGPAVSTVLTVVTDADDLLSRVSRLSRVQSRVDEASTIVSGNVSRFRSEGDANTVVLCLRDDHLKALTQLTASDLTFWMEACPPTAVSPSLAASSGAVGHGRRAAPVGQVLSVLDSRAFCGGFKLTYAIKSDVDHALLCCNIAGRVFKPWEVRATMPVVEFIGLSAPRVSAANGVLSRVPAWPLRPHDRLGKPV